MDIRIPQRIVDGDFAGWLRAAMEARHMSARMVGLRTGMNHSTITRLLYGYRQPTLANTISLLRLFGDGPTTHQPLPSRSSATHRGVSSPDAG